MPLCAVCGVECDEMEIIRDESQQCYVFEVQCHGESEKTIITDQLLAKIDSGAVERGVAFAPEEPSRTKIETYD